MPFVAGVDSSIAHTRIEIRDLDSGELVASAASPHTAVTPPLCEQDPHEWAAAFDEAWAAATAELASVAGSTAVVGISVAGQQHGMVALDADDRPIHPAKLGTDTESAPDAGWLRKQLASDVDDGSRAWADRTGSVPDASFTATKLSWLHRSHPDAWARLARVLLPHDYLTFRLTGRYTTDRGDASGTGFWSPTAGEYCWDILAVIDPELDWSSIVPTVLGPSEQAGTWNGIAVAVGTGESMATALGLGLRPGDAAVSPGSAGVAFAVSDVPTTDASGTVVGFADATGRYLPLARAVDGADALDALRAVAPVTGRVVRLDGERTVAIGAAVQAAAMVTSADHQIVQERWGLDARRGDAG